MKKKIFVLLSKFCDSDSEFWGIFHLEGETIVSRKKTSAELAVI